MAKVCIDCGHGGFDPGACAFGLKEKDLTLKVGSYLRDLLKRRGIDVVMTRDTDKAFGNDVSSDSINRTNAVKKSGADLCLSIHFNASNGTGEGCETVYQLNAGQPVINLANNILDNIAALGIKKRKAYSKESTKNRGTDYYFMLRMTRPVTSLIVECAFIDNAEDHKKFNTDDGRWLIAKAIYNSVLYYFGMEDDKPMEEQPKQPHWAQPLLDKSKAKGLITGEHNLDKPLTLGELLTVMDRAGLLD